MARLPESALLAPVLAWAAAAERAPSVGLEVRTHGRSRADLILLGDNGQIAAIELKVTDWRRALHQALLNQYCVHLSYVAIWHGAISAECEALCAEVGIGLLAVHDGTCEMLVSPETTAPHHAVADSIRRRVAET